MDIIVNKEKIIIDGHAKDIDTCNTLTNICDVLADSDKFRTIKYENGYGEFDSIEENGNKKFAPSGTKSLQINFPGTITEAYIIINIEEPIAHYIIKHFGLHVLYLTNGVIKYKDSEITPVVSGNSYSISDFCSGDAHILNCIVFYR